ncbi:MAG: hypothetical protein LBL62_08895, partial [Planctomycetaceae bacterium]|nr:hypothetical protein [Planctomycetaceae bacterium]
PQYYYQIPRKNRIQTLYKINGNSGECSLASPTLHYSLVPSMNKPITCAALRLRVNSAVLKSTKLITETQQREAVTQGQSLPTIYFDK